MEGQSPQIGRESFHRPLRAMKTPDQFSCRSYWSGGATSVGEGSTSSSRGTTSVAEGSRLAWTPHRLAGEPPRPAAEPLRQMSRDQ